MRNLIAFVFVLIGSAAQAGSDCKAPQFAGTLACTAEQAAAGLKSDAQSAWIACGGACRVVQYPDKVAIEFDGTTQDIPNARFLHGNRATACLNTLPLTYAQRPGVVTLLDANAENESTSLKAKIAMGDLEVFSDTARLSCDGSRLIAMDVYGGGGVLIFDAETGDPVTPPDEQDAWVLTSPDGSHAIALAEFETFDGYRAVNFDTGQFFELRAVHEIDLPGFGTDNTVALVRMTDAPVRTEIYNPATGAMIQSLIGTLPLGIPFALMDDKVQSLAELPEK
jgi:hypothetical protein